MGTAALITGHRAVRRMPVRVAAAGLVALLLLAGCDDTAEQRPTSSPSVRPTATSGASRSPLASPTRTPPPTPQPWPSGWEIGFCTAFSETVIAMELVVDVPRALAEEATDDALGLARELRATAAAAAELVGTVDGWATAQPTLDQMLALLDVAERIGRQYVRYLEDNRGGSLTRAGELTEEIVPLVAEANDGLSELAAAGIECPPHGLELESPPVP